MGSTTEVLVIGGGHGTTASRSLRAIEETRSVRFGPRPKIVHATVDDARAAHFSRIPSSGGRAIRVVAGYCVRLFHRKRKGEL
jgi:hypothetical protein